MRGAGQVGDQGGCERRSELIVKNLKFKKKMGEGVGGSSWGGQGGCERRIEVIVKMQKSRGSRIGGRGVGVGRGGRGRLETMLGVGGDVGYEMNQE